MGGEIASSEDPLRGRISINLAILPVVILHDVGAPFTGLDNGTTGATIEATARLFHEDTVGTRFNRDTFHRCSIPFPWIMHTYTASTRGQNCPLRQVLHSQSSDE